MTPAPALPAVPAQPHEAELRLETPGPAAARTLAAALAVEAADGPEGVAASVAAQGASVVLRVQAPDLASLRAGLHGLVRLFDVAARSVALLDLQGPEHNR